MRSLLLFFIVFVLPVFMQAQKYAISGLDILSLLNKDVSIVRSDHLRVEIQSTNKMYIHHKKAITYLKDPGKPLSPILYYDDLSDIKEFELSIYDASGELVRHYNKRDVKDEARLSYSIYSDTRLQFFEVGEFDYPLTVEYEYEKKMKGIFRFTPWVVQEFDQKVERARCDIILDDGIQLYYRFENSEVEPHIMRKGNERQYTWILEDIPAIEKEPFAPHALNVLPSLQYGTSHFEVDNFEGSSKSWANFGDFLQQFYDDAQELPDHVKNEIHELTASIPDDRQKIKVLYDYLQDNTRYVSVQIGVGGWKTYDADYVAEHKYGDCKALSNYLGSLLSEVGITSYPVIIESNEIPYAVTQDFVFDRFNHAILYIPSEQMFVECTASSGPEAYVGARIQDRKALLVDGSDSRLVQTPTIPYYKNKKQSVTQIHIYTNKPCSLSSTEYYYNHRHEDWRIFQDHFDWKDTEQSFIKQFPLTISSLDTLTINVDQEEALAQLSYKLSTKEIGTSMGNRIFLYLNPLYRSNISLPEDEDRVHPIVINKSGLDSNILYFHIPDDYDLESMPESPISHKSKWGTYKLSFEFTDPQTLRVIRQYEYYKVNAAAEQYNKIKTFFDNVAQSDSNTKIVLVKQ